VGIGGEWKCLRIVPNRGVVVMLGSANTVLLLFFRVDGARLCL
jgi:hypothetical protein